MPDGFPSQRASNAESISIPWSCHVTLQSHPFRTTLSISSLTHGLSLDIKYHYHIPTTVTLTLTHLFVSSTRPMFDLVHRPHSRLGRPLHFLWLDLKSKYIPSMYIPIQIIGSLQNLTHVSCEWVIKFNGLSQTADSEVHAVHDGCAVVACTKFCSYQSIRNGIRAKWNCHWN